MISVVTVVLNKIIPFLDVFVESILEKSKYISEVIVINVDSNPGLVSSWTKGRIDFKIIGGRQRIFATTSPPEFCSQHAYGLHLGIKECRNDYIMLSDPDIFFYTEVDDCYLSLKEKFELQFIGISRSAAVCHNIKSFPTVVNCLIHKSDLPYDTYSEEISPLPTFVRLLASYSNRFPFYLYPMCREQVPIEVRSRFPNPEGHYETGTRLYLWSQDKNWRWLSFQTIDLNVYSKNFYRTNFDLREKFPPNRLLYHQSIVTLEEGKFAPFKAAYEKSRS